MKFKGFGILLVVLIVAALVNPLVATAQSVRVAVSLGWQENESGQRFTQGYEAAFAELGWQVSWANANYDPKLQSEQIDAIIQTNPDALFVTASDPVGITQALNRAVNAGIPVFVADGFIAGVPAVTMISSNQFGMGQYSMQYIAEQLGGEGKIGVIDLPQNENWDLRGQGAMAMLNENYPNIEVVAKWSYDPTGAVTPRQAIDNMLTANPSGGLDAIWCAWDGAAMEGAQAVMAAGRADEIITTGIDGGEHAFELIGAGTPFKLSMAQSIYWMSYMSVQYAAKYLNGEQVPRFVIAPVYAADQNLVNNVPDGLQAIDYDMPGVAQALGWVPVK